jgi:transposase-like protein
MGEAIGKSGPCIDIAQDLRDPCPEGRVGGRRKKLDAAKRREIAESVITGRKSGAEMARLYNISQPTVSRIVAQHRMASP